MITEERLQGAIKLANEITGATFQLWYDEWIYKLIQDWEVIADWSRIEPLYNVLVESVKQYMY